VTLFAILVYYTFLLYSLVYSLYCLMIMQRGSNKLTAIRVPTSSSRACPSLKRSRFHCPFPPFAILSSLPSWYQADVERPQVMFNRTKPSSSWSTGRSFPIAWQSRNNGSKSTCMIHSAVGPRDMTKKRRRLSRRVVDSCVWHVRWSTSTFVTWRR